MDKLELAVIATGVVDYVQAPPPDAATKLEFIEQHSIKRINGGEGITGLRRH